MNRCFGTSLAQATISPWEIRAVMNNRYRRRGIANYHSERISVTVFTGKKLKRDHFGQKM